MDIGGCSGCPWMSMNVSGCGHVGGCGGCRWMWWMSVDVGRRGCTDVTKNRHSVDR